MSNLPWLNGWPINGWKTILIGSGVHCIGCGLLFGVTCIVVDPDHQPPPELPDWPFPVEGCPVHAEPQPQPEPEGEPCRVCAGTGRRRTRTLP